MKRAIETLFLNRWDVVGELLIIQKEQSTGLEFCYSFVSGKKYKHNKLFSIFLKVEFNVYSWASYTFQESIEANFESKMLNGMIGFIKGWHDSFKNLECVLKRINVNYSVINRQETIIVHLGLGFSKVHRFWVGNQRYKSPK